MARTTNATTKTAAKKKTVAKTKKNTAEKTTGAVKPVKKASVTKTGKVAVKKAAPAKTEKVSAKTAAKKTTVVKKVVPKVKTLTPVAIIAQAMLDKKARQVVSLDLSKIDTAICDYFVVCHADSTTQVAAIADNVEKELFAHQREWPIRVQGKENALWVILDYSDVVVHIFQTDYRLFYRLEELWADAEKKLHSEEPKKQIKK